MNRFLAYLVLGGLLFTCLLKLTGAAELRNFRLVQGTGSEKKTQPEKKTDTKVDPKKKKEDPEKKDPPRAPETPEALAQRETDALPPSAAPEMLGDVSPVPAYFQRIAIITQQGRGGSTAPGAVVTSQTIANDVIAPRLRGFKVADNASAAPQDRVYFSFNYFSDLYGSANQALGGNLRNINFARETFGVEKSFLDGNASIGLRLPVNTLNGSSDIGLGGSSTAFGDLGIIFKYAFWRDRRTGDVVSGGLAVVAPTGPNRFGGVDAGALGLHSTLLQPYAAFLLNRDRYFVQGFSSIDIPTTSNDVTLWYNDIAVGYWMLRRQDNSFLTGIAPTVEAHVTTPLNHRSFLDPNDLAGTPDVVNLTAGLNFEFNQRTRFALGAVVPVTGPRPFDFEVMAQFRMRY